MMRLVKKFRFLSYWDSESSLLTTCLILRGYSSGNPTDILISVFSMKTFVKENYPLELEEYKDFASFLAMKGQTESTERDLFAWLLDNYLATQDKDLWVYTEDKALRGSIEKKAFDLSVIRWSEKRPIEVREHIMEFKSERHGKFRNAGAVENFLNRSLLADIYKMWRHFASEGGKKDGTKYWQCQIFYSFLLGEVRAPRKYATYSENEKSSKKGISEKLEEIDRHYADCIDNFTKEIANDEKNTKGRTFILTRKDKYGKKVSEEKTVKFRVNTDQSIKRKIAVSEHRGIRLRSDIFLMSIDFDI